MVERPISARAKSQPLGNLLIYSGLITILVIVILSILLWIVNQIPDPVTQRTFLQIGGGIILIAAIFVVVFMQNLRLDELLGRIAKIWKG